MRASERLPVGVRARVEPLLKMMAERRGRPETGFVGDAVDESVYFLSVNRRKRSVVLDFKETGDLRALKDMIRSADVLVENFRPGAMEKWGLGWETLSRINPGLVMVRLSGFGQSGPYKDRPGFGAIGESMGGLRYVTGYPDRAPVRVGVSIGDSIAALHGVIGALAALRHRDVNGGRGQCVDVALYEAVFNMMESVLPEYDVFGFIRERSGASLPGIVPSNTYVTRDGKYVVIGANADSIFRRMMNAIGRPDLATDPALAHNDGRVARTEEIERVIGDWVAAHDLEHVLGTLERADVPSGKIYDIADIVRDPHYAARGTIATVPDPELGDIKMQDVTPRFSRTPGRIRHAGLALAIGLGACLNALLLYLFLKKETIYVPQPGWAVFVLKIAAAVAFMAIVLFTTMGEALWWLQAGWELKVPAILGLVLLGTAAYAAWWTTKLCDWTGNNDFQLNNTLPRYNNTTGSPTDMWYDWIYKRVAENAPYDDLVDPRTTGGIEFAPGLTLGVQRKDSGRGHQHNSGDEQEASLRPQYRRGPRGGKSRRNSLE